MAPGHVAVPAIVAKARRRRRNRGNGGAPDAARIRHLPAVVIGVGRGTGKLPLEAEIFERKLGRVGEPSSELSA